MSESLKKSYVKHDVTLQKYYKIVNQCVQKVMLHIELIAKTLLTIAVL